MPDEGDALDWTEITPSGNDGPHFDMAILPDGERVIRDPKAPDGPQLHLTEEEWAALPRQL